MNSIMYQYYQYTLFFFIRTMYFGAEKKKKLAKKVSAKTIHGKKLFKIIGVDIFNEISNLPKSSHTRQNFLKQYKNYLIDQY